MDHTRFLRSPALLKSEDTKNFYLLRTYMCAFHATDSYKPKCIFILQISSGEKKSMSETSS